MTHMAPEVMMDGRMSKAADVSHVCRCMNPISLAQIEAFTVRAA